MMQLSRGGRGGLDEGGNTPDRSRPFKIPNRAPWEIQEALDGEHAKLGNWDPFDF